VKLTTKYVKLLSAILLVLVAIKGNAQELLGVTLGNYSGSAGLMLNPAGMTTNKVYLDINLVTANVFVRNNFAYIPAEDISIWDLFNQNYQFPTYGDDNRNMLYYKNDQLKNATVNARVLGPSAMLQVK